MTLTYKELQAKLKDLRANGYDVQVKLNSKQEILQAEFDRLTRELEHSTATATNMEVVATQVDEDELQCFVSNDSYEETQQYCDFVPQQLVYGVTEFDKLGNTKQYDFGGQVVYYICSQDWFAWELQQWLTQHEGIACDVEFVELETYTAVETQPLAVSSLANWKQAEPLPLYVLLLACMLMGLAWLGRTVAERVGTFARETDETAWRAWQNTLWLARCCWWFAVGFLKLG